MKYDAYGDAYPTEIIINQQDYDSNNICAFNLRQFQLWVKTLNPLPCTPAPLQSQQTNKVFTNLPLAPIKL
jgi:hypothetical protein